MDCDGMRCDRRSWTLTRSVGRQQDRKWLLECLLKGLERLEYRGYDSAGEYGCCTLILLLTLCAWNRSLPSADRNLLISVHGLILPFVWTWSLRHLTSAALPLPLLL